MEHKRYRILKRPPGRRPESLYRVKLGTVSLEDNLTLRLFDENQLAKPLVTFVFSGSDIAGKESIHFRAREYAGLWEISFSGGVNPARVIV
jgi:hypothetical protein